jgi:hypothetical protein
MTEEEQQNTCPSFRSFAAAHDTWRLSRLDNGTRIFEEEEARTNNNELWLSPPPGCKVGGNNIYFSQKGRFRCKEENSFSGTHLSPFQPLPPHLSCRVSG